MPISFIAFDGWKPSGGLFGEGWAVVDDLVSFYGSWRPVRKFVPLGSGVAASPLNGTHIHRWSTGLGSNSYLPDAQTLFTGSGTKLYTVDPSTGAFTDVSKAAGYGPGSAGWRFVSVGNDIYASNWVDPIQRRTNNAGLFADGVVSTFKPVPRFLAAIREHVVAANLNQANRFQDEIAWSDADDPTNYDPPTLTSLSIAGSKRLVSMPGQITGLLGGQYGLVFKRKGIFYLEYTGTSQVFRPDVLSPHIGTAYPSSIINTRYGVFFLGPDGFYQMIGLSEPQKISPPGVDQLLLGSSFISVAAANPAIEDAKIMGFEHSGAPLVGWLLNPAQSLGATTFFFYDPMSLAWTQSTQGSLLGSNPTYYTAIFSRPYGDIYTVLAAVQTDGATCKYAPWSNAVSGVVQSPYLQLRFRPANFEASYTAGTSSAGAGKQGQSLVKGILPIFSKLGVGGTPLTLTVTVEAMLDPFLGVWGTPETRVATDRDTIAGWYPFQIAGRFFRITINCAAEDFAHFDGIWVDQELLT